MQISLFLIFFYEYIKLLNYFRGIRGPEAILMARPEEIEEEAVKRVCTLARHSNVPIIIDQPTSLSALEVIRSQKEKGQVVVGQASAISMIKNGSEYYNENWSKAAALVTSPPLRDDADVQVKFFTFY